MRKRPFPFLALVQSFLADSEQSVNPTFVAHDVVVEETAVSANGSTVTRPNFEAPRDAMESQMTRIWEEMLEIKGIGIHDNFFDLGGSSWLATRLFCPCARCDWTQFCRCQTLLEASTVAGMVKVMREQSDGKRTWSPTVTLKVGDEGKRPFFFVPGAGGSLIRLDKLVGQLQLDRRMVAFQVPGFEGEVEPFKND